MAISWASQQGNAGISWVKLYFSDGLYCVSSFIFFGESRSRLFGCLESKEELCLIVIIWHTAESHLQKDKYAEIYFCIYLEFGQIKFWKDDLVRINGRIEGNISVADCNL